MNNTPIYITRNDNSKLRLLIATALYSNDSATFRKLQEELDRAAILDDTVNPPDIVTMDSTVEFEDLATSEIEEYTLTFPERANVDKKRLSILAPIGTALIGCRVGDLVRWFTPGGVRQLKVRRVTPPTRDSEPHVSLPTQLASMDTQ
jgi:regulator of nucleoside diphosphate kinase